MTETKQEYETGNKLAVREALVFGARDVIRDLALRLQSTMIGAQKLSPMEAATLAQVAIAHGLDPYNGEIWYIKDKDGNPKGVMVGVKGLRKSARRQLNKMQPGANYVLRNWSKEDPKKWDAPDGSIVYRVELQDSILTCEWIKQFTTLKNSDPSLSFETFAKLFGEPPVTVGIGVYNPAKEYSKMQPSAVARKRAEADALKMRFDVLLDLEYNSDIDIEDGEYIDIDEIADELETIPAVIEQPTVTVVEPEPNPSRPLKPDQLKARLLENANANKKAVANGKRQQVAAAIEAVFGNKDARHDVQKFLTGELSLTKVPDNLVVAMWNWLQPKYNEASTIFEIDNMAKKELTAAYTHAHKDAGQADIFSESVDEAN